MLYYRHRHIAPLGLIGIVVSDNVNQSRQTGKHTGKHIGNQTGEHIGEQTCVEPLRYSIIRLVLPNEVADTASPDCQNEIIEECLIACSEQNNGDIPEVSKLYERTFKQLSSYASGEVTVFDLPLDLDGTEFQRRVWGQIASIPYGSVSSYSQVARQVGGTNYARAVAGACHQNPIPIIIPCHRVIGSGGQLTGYRGGVELKVQLLDLEKKSASTKY